jgi:phenylacetate-CoA ligase
MDDVLVLSNKPCQCDWPFPVIETIAGRREEFLWFTKANGMTEFIHPIVLAEFFVPGLEKFQFTQTSPNTLVLKAIARDERSNIVVAIRKKMHEILLEKSLVEHVRLDIELVDEIRSNPKTGKFKLIIPFARQISDGEKL